MRLAAALASLAVVAGYFILLMPAVPGFGLLQPRGGVVMLGLSLLIANALIWQAGNARWNTSARFQLAAAGWIWILVQGGAQVYMYRMA